MAHWIAQYEGPDGWKELVSCRCSACGVSAPLVLSEDMDGVKYKYKLSKHCIFCDAAMEDDPEYIEKRFI